MIVHFAGYGRTVQHGGQQPDGRGVASPQQGLSAARQVHQRRHEPGGNHPPQQQPGLSQLAVPDLGAKQPDMEEHQQAAQQSDDAAESHGIESIRFPVRCDRRHA